MDKLRILGLHGYHGSAAALREQQRCLAATLAPEAELVFVDAPSLGEGDFGWWQAVRTPDNTAIPAALRRPESGRVEPGAKSS